MTKLAKSIKKIWKSLSKPPASIQDTASQPPKSTSIELSSLCTGLSAGVQSERVNVYDTAVDQYEEDLQAAGVLMQTYIRRNILIDLHHYPIQRYVKDQCVLFTQQVFKYLKDCHLAAGLLREGVENLYFMATYYLHKLSWVAKMAQVELGAIIKMMQRLLEISEELSQLTTTNWTRVHSLVQQDFSSITQSIEKYAVGRLEFFKMDRLLGAGGFGAVYKALLGEAVCVVKIVPQKLLPCPENAVVDKEVASVIRHVCLVRYHATFLAKDAYVTVMEYIRGVDVIKLVRLATRLPGDLVRVIIAQLVLALQHMHYKGFIHRDVKPSNMMIVAGARVKLIDFDTSKVCISRYHGKHQFFWQRRTSNEFKDGETAGSLAYMAPEILTQKNYGRAADWFSFGATAFELSTGKLPVKVRGGTVDEQKESVLAGEHKWPTDHTDELLQALVEQCLIKNPKKRIGTRRYLEIQHHAYFDKTNFATIECSIDIMPFDPLASVALGHLYFAEDGSNHQESPHASPSAEGKRRQLFGDHETEDTGRPDQLPLYTFSSNGFQAAIEMIERGEVPHQEHIRTLTEAVFSNDSAVPFVFEGL